MFYQIMISIVKKHLQNALFANAYLIMLTRLLGTVTGFVFWMVAARALPPEDVGLASGIVASSMLLAGLAQLGLNYGLIKFLPDSHQPTAIINNSVGLVGLASAVLAAFFLATLGIWSPDLKLVQSDISALATFIILVASTALVQLVNWAFLARRRPGFVLAISTIQSLLAILILLSFALFGDAAFQAVLLAYALSTFLSLAISIMMLLPHAEPGFALAPSFKPYFHVPSRYYVGFSYAADQLQKSPDTILTILVLNVLGAGASAPFFVVWSVISGLRGLVGSYSMALFTEGANNPETMTLYAKKSLKAGLACSMLVTIAVTLGGKVILLLYGRSYVEAAYTLLVILAFSLIPQVALSLYTSVLRVTGEMKLLLAILALDLALGLLCTYFFMLRFGVSGVGIGWLLSRVLSLLLALALQRFRRRRKRMTPVVVPAALSQ